MPLVHKGREIPRVTARLDFADRLGSLKARWGIGRLHFLVEPGLYAIGNPNADSPVLVTANYKMSFDRLRSQLSGYDAWILVLDTKGVNVWCAAGKGTFGTKELVERIKLTHLPEIISHCTLIVPQLGAPGVSAHEVKKRSGFKVIFGPVRAEDLPAFIDAGMKATPEMRRVRFPLRERISLSPLELLYQFKYAWIIIIGFFILAGLGKDGYSLARSGTIGLRSLTLFLTAYCAGLVLTPIFLPWLPGRAFSLKGAFVGIMLALAALVYSFIHPGIFTNQLNAFAWLLIMPTVASYLGMNFTGVSTYTSLSGVKREMRYAVPLQISGGLTGLVLWLTGLYF